MAQQRRNQPRQVRAREATRTRLDTSGRRLRARPATPAQSRALKELKLAIQRLEDFPQHVLSDLMQEPARLEEFREHITNFDTAILTAARRGLRSHPLVADRLRTLRAVGDWETLRQPRLGLETGVRRPHSMDDLDLFQEINNLVARGRYPTWELIRRVLTSRGIIAPMSRPAFLKLRRGLGFTGRLPKP